MTSSQSSDGATVSATRVRAKEFQLSWVAKFGVQAATRDAASGEVLSAKCLFCERFGRDADAEEHSRKRKRTANVQHFKQPWRGDNIASHMRKQHALRFAAYCALSLPDKARYFDDDRGGYGSGDLDDDAPEVEALGLDHELPALETASEVLINSDTAGGGEAQARADSQCGAAQADATVGAIRPMDASVRLPRAIASLVAAGSGSGAQALTFALPAASGTSVGDSSGEQDGSFFQLVDKRVALFAYKELLPPARAESAQTLPAELALEPEDELGDVGDAVRDVAADADADAGRCLLRVAARQQFARAMSFLAAGFSPELCDELLRLSSGGDHAAAASHESRTLTHARHACAMNYQAISELLRAAWAFTLVLDAGLSADRDARFVAVRVRCVADGKMHDAHLVTLPDTSDPDAMIQRLARAADAVCAEWREKLVGIANDGAVRMSESLAATVALLQQQYVASPGCYMVWGGARQVEAVVQRAFVSLCDDAFVATTLTLAERMRRRPHLVASATSCCPEFAGSQWMAMRDTLAWFAANAAAVRRHLGEEAACGEFAADDAWWVALFSLHALVKHADVCMLSMQGLTTHGAEQNRAIEKLLITLVASGYVDGPSRFRAEPEGGVLRGEYRVTLESAEMFVKKQGAAADASLAGVQRDHPALHSKLLRAVATMLAESVSCLATLRSERARAAGLSDLLPPVRPQDLATSATAFDLSRLLSLQRERLTRALDEQEPARIAADFAALLAAYEREPGLKHSLDSLPATASFAASWERVGGRFPSLERFAGGLATVFRDPRAVVDACDASSSSLTRVDAAAVVATSAALECALHARQFPALQRVSASRASRSE